ncbi:MAG: radical SAM protein, partial [Lachnospiraceae bacterium]|nr:radical SAM protein [Lachnospiraceae bacterium]
VPCQSWLTDGNLGNFLDEDWEKIWYSGKCENRRYYSGMMTGLCPLRATSEMQIGGTHDEK